METAIVDLTESADGGHTRVFDEPKSVHLELAKGEKIPPHQHPGETILFHTLDGEITLTLDEAVYELSPGKVVRFSGDKDISPKAETDARALLVFVGQN